MGGSKLNYKQVNKVYTTLITFPTKLLFFSFFSFFLLTFFNTLICKSMSYHICKQNFVSGLWVFCDYLCLEWLLCSISFVFTDSFCNFFTIDRFQTQQQRKSLKKISRRKNTIATRRKIVFLQKKLKTEIEVLLSTSIQFQKNHCSNILMLTTK